MKLMTGSSASSDRIEEGNLRMLNNFQRFEAAWMIEVAIVAMGKAASAIFT